MLDSFTEEEKENDTVNETKDGFVAVAITKEAKLITSGKIKFNVEEVKSTVELLQDGEETYEAKICRVNNLFTEEKTLKKDVAFEKAQLHLLTKTTIEQLTDPQVYHLLELKWINSLLTELYKMPEVLIHELTTKVQALADKYATTYANVVAEIHETESTLTALMDELTGNAFDIQGLNEFQTLLKSE